MKSSDTILITTLLLVQSSLPYAQPSNGLVQLKSSHSVSTTLNKLENTLRSKGMTIFNRISHSGGAEKAGLALRETEILIFGNPKVGTLLMQCAQTAGLDLPLKALAYQDSNEQVWLIYNDPKYIASRHGAKDCKEVITKMSGALASFSKAATQ